MRKYGVATSRADALLRHRRLRRRPDVRPGRPPLQNISPDGEMAEAGMGMPRPRAARRSSSLWAAVAVAATSLLAGCAADLLPPGAAMPTQALARVPTNEPGVFVGVLDEGWHTELILPAGDLGSPLAALHRSFPEAKYLAFGWGNRDFYMAAHPGLGTAIAALFPSSSVVFVQGLPERPLEALPAGAELRWVCVSPTGMGRLDAYLGDYLRKGPSGAPITLGPGPLPQSRFFASIGTYDAFHTCNTWTAAGLEFAGLSVTAQDTVFAGQVMSEIRSLRACPGIG